MIAQSLGNANAFDLLEEAAHLREVGRDVDAAKTLVRVLDRFPRTAAGTLAYETLNEQAREIINGGIGSGAIQNFAAGMPGWEECKSAESKYVGLGFSWALAEAARARGDEIAKNEHHRQTIGLARRLVREHPDDPVVVLATRHMFEASVELGEDVRTQTMDEFRRIISEQQPGLATFCARAYLATEYNKFRGDVIEGNLQLFGLLEDFDAARLQTILEDPTVYTDVKAWIHLYVGKGLYAAEDYEAAVPHFEACRVLFSEGNSMLELASYFVACSEAHLAMDDPATQRVAYDAFLAEYPKGYYGAHALLRLSQAYIEDGNDLQGARMLSTVVDDFPGSQVEGIAKQTLDYMLNTGKVSRSALNGTEPVWLAKACGPIALKYLLDEKGITTTIQELATLSGTDERGTSMLGLVNAAGEMGLLLDGVEAEDASSLNVPFLAYVDGKHFVLVEDVQSRVVTIRDFHRRLRIPLSEFERRWNGEALTIHEAPTIADSLGESRLASVFGGDGGGIGFPPNYNDIDPAGLDTPQTPAPSAPNNQCPGSCPFGGGGGGAPAGGYRGSPTSSPLYPPNYLDLGINTAGVGAWYDTIGGAAMLSATDIAIDTVGDLSLVFSRYYNNNPAEHPPLLTRWSTRSDLAARHMGEWYHSFNSFVRCSSLYSRAYVYDYTGTVALYQKYASTGGWDYYANKRKDSELRRNATTNLMILRRSDGIELSYTRVEQTLGGQSVFVNILTSVTDRSGNALTFTYVVEGGQYLLSRVDTPASDGRFIEFAYDSQYGTAVMTTATLKDSTSTLREVNYDYAPYLDGTTLPFLDAVAVTGEASTVQYGYEVCEFEWLSCDDPNNLYWIPEKQGSYLSSIIDKAGETYSIAMDVQTHHYFCGPASGGYFSPPFFGLTEFTYPDGSFLEVQGGAGGSWSALVNYTDATATSPISAMEVEKSPFGLPTSIAFAEDEAALYETPEIWNYEYDLADGEYNLSVVYGPYSETEPYATFTYDEYGRVLTIRAGSETSDPITTYTYGPETYHADSVTDPTGLVTSYDFDASLRLTQSLYPEHTGTDGFEYTYDTDGNLETITDALGNVWTYGYDDRSNLTSVIDPLENETTFAHDEFGRVELMTDALGRETTYVWSDGGCASCGSMGNLIGVIDADANSVAFVYDVNDNLTKVTDALNQSIGYEYDEMNRLEKIAVPFGATDKTIFAYNEGGLLESVTDPEAKVTSYVYDFRGRVEDIVDPLGTTTIGYDDFDNVTTVTDGNGHTWTYEYNEYAQLETAIDPEGKETHYEYDLAGMLTREGYGTGGTFDPVDFTYHPTTGLLTQIDYGSYAGTDTANFEYDALGRLTRVLDWIDDVNGIQYSYDELSRLTDVMDYDSSTLTYVYNAVGNISAMTDYHGNTTDYTYTDLDQLDTITAPGSKVWDFDYTANGLPSGYTHGNGMVTSYLYDTRGRLENIKHKDGAAIVQEFAYEFDENDNVTKVTMEDGSYWVYEYDGRDRLDLAIRYDDSDVEEYREDYGYDGGDNLEDKTTTVAGQSPIVTTYVVNDANEMTALIEGAATWDYGYDAAGRQVSKSDGTYTASYAYRFGDMLETVNSDNPSVPEVSYLYGGDGMRRAREEEGAGITWYNWEGSALQSEEEYESAYGPIVSWAWDFDNNGTVDSTVQNPSHTYLVPGTYTVKLTVTESIGGATDSKVSTNLITVDPTPTVQFSSAGSSAAESTTARTIPITRGSSYAYDTIVGVSVVGGTAANPADYTLPSTVTIPSGSATANLNVTVVNDTLWENSETIGLNITPIQSAVIGAQYAHIATITDNDSAPQVKFAVSASSVSEDAATVGVNVILSQPAGKTITVNYGLGALTATLKFGSNPGPWDFEFIAGQQPVTFQAGETSKTVYFTLLGDTAIEGNEYFDVTLNTPAPTGVTIGTPNTHRVTLLDNDGGASLPVAPEPNEPRLASVDAPDYALPDRESEMLASVDLGDLPYPPVADFSADVTSGRAPLTVQFTDTSTGATVRGGGALTRTYIGNLADIAGLYPAAGAYRYFTHDLLGSSRGAWDSGRDPLGAIEYTPYGGIYTGGLGNATTGFGGEIQDPATALNLYLFRAYDPHSNRWLTREPLGLDGPNLYAFVGGNPTSSVDIAGLFQWGPRSIDNPLGAELMKDLAGWPILGAAVGSTLGGNNGVLPKPKPKPASPKAANGGNSGGQGAGGSCNNGGGTPPSGGGSSPPSTGGHGSAPPPPPNTPGGGGGGGGPKKGKNDPKFKTSDGLKRHNNQPGDAARQAGLNHAQKQTLHRIIGREHLTTYQEILDVAEAIARGEIY